jgi:hypothetical protein
MTDVRLKGSLDDYTGELQASVPIRLTDGGRAAPTTNPSQTLQDFALAFAVPCGSPTSAVGGSCAAETTVEALIPGAVREGNRAIWGLGQVELRDGGPDGDADTADNAVFARQGVFVP